MGMNRPKSDKWPPFEPTRHVLVKCEDHKYAQPWQGLDVDWKREGSAWRALVVFIDESADGSPLVQRWLPVNQLRPIETDPDPRQDEWF